MTSAFHRLITTNKPTKVQELSAGKSGALLATYRGGIKAVLKLAKKSMPSGKKTQRGLLVRSQPNREVAFYRLAVLLGYDHLVPETVLTIYKGHEASAQLYVPAAPLAALEPQLKKSVGGQSWRNLVVKTCSLVPKYFWKQLLALDIVGGARDRHANNIGIKLLIKNDRPVYRLVAWDNATTFGVTFEKYHNVFHKLLFRKSVLDFDAEWFKLQSISRSDMFTALASFLAPEEIEHAYLRKQFFLDYPYRLPWKVCSQGNDDSNAFPAYTDYFVGADDNAPLEHAA